MFSEQVSQLDALYGLMAEEAIDVLRYLLGDCSATLAHRGPVSIKVTQPDNATDAALTIANYQEDGVALDILAGGIRGLLHWGEAQANWQDAAGNAAFVVVHKVNGKDGDNELDDKDVIVFLPRIGNQDPAVYAGDIIAYYYDENGKAICPYACDGSRVGDLRTQSSAATIPIGWQLADGSNGTVDMRDQLAFGYNAGGGTYGTPGGAVGETYSLTGAPTIGSESTGITLNAHSPHTHNFTTDSMDGQWNVGTTDLAHEHTVNELTVDSHKHGYGTLTVASHQHSVQNGVNSCNALSPDHAHGVGSFAVSSHRHFLTIEGNDSDTPTKGTEDMNFMGTGDGSPEQWYTSYTTPTLNGVSAGPSSRNLTGNTGTASPAVDEGETDTATVNGISGSTDSALTTHSHTLVGTEVTLVTGNESSSITHTDLVNETPHTHTFAINTLTAIGNPAGTVLVWIQRVI